MACSIINTYNWIAHQRLFHLPECCPVSHKLNLFCASICDRDILCGRLKVILTVKWPNVILALCLLQFRQTGTAFSTSVQAYIAHVCACASYQVCKGEFSVAVSQAVTSEVGSTQWHKGTRQGTAFCIHNLSVQYDIRSRKARTCTQVDSKIHCFSQNHGNARHHINLKVKT